MRHTTPILYVLVVLGALEACPAGNLFDDASQALAQGDVPRAVDRYREDVRQAPTSEAYNNLGVALERYGDLTGALRAYQESLNLPDASNVTALNLQRARFRAWLQCGLPYATGLLAFWLTVVSIRWLSKRLAHAWHLWRFRMRFRHVRLICLSQRVLCRNGQDQPDGKVYDDSESIILKAELDVPLRNDIYPLQIELEILRPDGTIWKTLQESINTANTERNEIEFQLKALEGLIDLSGSWKMQLSLRNIGKRLGLAAFTVVTQADLVADLEAVNVRLVSVRGERTCPEKIVFNDVDAVVPYAVIRPRSCHPAKFAGMRLSLDLANVDKADQVETQELPLAFRDGVMEFCSVSRPIAGDPIARKIGKWEFCLRVEGRTLARMPFVITSFEQALDGLRVKSFEVAGIPRSGKVAPLSKAIYAKNLRALCPVVEVESLFPSARIAYRMTMGVCLDGEPVAGVEGSLLVQKKSVELMPGEFNLPSFPDGRDSAKVVFVLVVEGRLLGQRGVTLHLRQPRCADSQGRIVDPPSVRMMDYDSEAARILGEARTAG